MADTSVKSTVDIEVGVSGTGSIKSIKTELKEAKADAIAMARAFGENSKEANLAASKVAKLTDEVEDLGLKIKSLNPDKFQRLATLGQGIASGFAAATGAVALFGSESEELNKTMIKLQSAIAISQGVQGFADFLKTASPQMIAISVAIGILVGAWQMLTKAIEADTLAEKALHDQRIANAKYLQDEEDLLWKNRSARRKESIAEGEKELKATITNEERRISLMRDGYAKEVQDQNLKNIIRRAEAEEAGQDLVLLEAVIQQEFADLRKKYADLEQKDLQAKKAEEKTTYDADYKAYLANLEIQYQALLKSNQQKLDAEKLFNDEFDKIADDELNKQQSDADKKLANEKSWHQARYELALGGLQALSDLTYLFAGKSEEAQKRAFNIQKALSIAQTIISTIEAAQAAYKSGVANPLANLVPGGGVALGVAQATIVTAAGLAKVKQIQQTQFNSTNVPTSSGGAVSAPSIAPTTEQQRQVIGNSTGASNIIKQSDVKVYVTETDISKSINRVGDIRRRAIIK